MGKSTLAVHFTAWCHEQKIRVALVDADAQGCRCKDETDEASGDAEDEALENGLPEEGRCASSEG